MFSFLVISKLKLFHPHFKFSASADFTDLESEQSKETRKELASAFCAVAELYMTDLCDNPEAEHECTESVRKAIGKKHALKKYDQFVRNTRCFCNVWFSQENTFFAISIMAKNQFLDQKKV